jgi:hypothetical protein
MHLGTFDAGKLGEDGYDHGIDHIYPPLDENGKLQLKKLSELNRAGDIYVTTSTKLFQYLLSWQRLNYVVDGFDIRIISIDDQVRGSYVPTLIDLQGVTFYTRDPRQTRVFIGDQEITGRLCINPDDGYAQSISIPILHITRPDDTVQLLTGVENTVYSAGGHYHSVSYNQSITDRLSADRSQLTVRLPYKSGHVLIVPQEVLDNEISFFSKGSAKVMNVILSDKPDQLQLSANMPFELVSGNQILDRQKVTDGQVIFRTVPVGGLYHIRRVKS